MKVSIFLVGAPKCGTTSVAESLRRNKVVSHSNRKELFYFDYFYKVKTPDWYHSQFDWTCSLPKIDATPTYMYSSEAIMNILEYNKNSKFIVMLRNPVDRINSHYYDLKNWIKNFKLDSLDKDIAVKRIGVTIIFNLYRDSLYSSYIEFIRNKTEKVMVFTLDQLRDEGYRQLVNFVNPNFDFGSFFPVHNNKKNAVRSVAINNILGAELLRDLASLLPVRGQKFVRELYHRASSLNTNELVADYGADELKLLLTQDIVNRLSLDYEQSLKFMRRA